MEEDFFLQIFSCRRIAEYEKKMWKQIFEIFVKYAYLWEGKRNVRSRKLLLAADVPSQGHLTM